MIGLDPKRGGAATSVKVILPFKLLIGLLDISKLNSLQNQNAGSDSSEGGGTKHSESVSL